MAHTVVAFCIFSPSPGSDVLCKVCQLGLEPDIPHWIMLALTVRNHLASHPAQLNTSAAYLDLESSYQIWFSLIISSPWVTVVHIKLYLLPFGI